MLSEISQIEKDKYCMISLICGIKKYIRLVNITKKKQIHIENKLAITSGEREEGDGQDRGRGLRSTNY